MVRVPYDVTSGGSGSRRWGGNSDKPPEALPTQQAVCDACRALRRSRRGMAYLCRHRGLARAQIVAYGLGLMGRHPYPSYLFPVRGEGGELLTVVKHSPWADQRYDVPRGSQAALYPSLPRGQAVVLVAGMFDALLARQHGLPAVTTTCGARLPSELATRFAGKRVAVVFDAGEEDKADRAVERLPCEAWAVRLPLPEGDDVAAWFAKYGRTREELLHLIQEAKREANMGS
jgi:hypothetical protein